MNPSRDCQQQEASNNCRAGGVYWVTEGGAIWRDLEPQQVHPALIGQYPVCLALGRLRGAAIKGAWAMEFIEKEKGMHMAANEQWNEKLPFQNIKIVQLKSIQSYRRSPAKTMMLSTRPTWMIFFSLYLFSLEETIMYR